MTIETLDVHDLKLYCFSVYLTSLKVLCLGLPVCQNVNPNLIEIGVAFLYGQGKRITSPDDAREFLMLELAHLEHEVFYCIFLDNQHRIIEAEACFQGTIDSANVYPRELVKRTLQLNARALILAHNHPSGLAEPSEADRAITRKLIDALNLVEVRVLDHFIIAGIEQFSFAERGLL